MQLEEVKRGKNTDICLTIKDNDYMAPWDNEESQNIKLVSKEDSKDMSQIVKVKKEVYEKKQNEESSK